MFEGEGNKKKKILLNDADFYIVHIGFCYFTLASHNKSMIWRV